MKMLAAVVAALAVLIATPASAFSPDSDKNQDALRASAGVLDTSRDMSHDSTMSSTGSDGAGSGSAEPSASEPVSYNHYQALFLQEIWTIGGGD